MTLDKAECSLDGQPSAASTGGASTSTINITSASGCRAGRRQAGSAKFMTTGTAESIKWSPTRKTAAKTHVRLGRGKLAICGRRSKHDSMDQHAHGPPIKHASWKSGATKKAPKA
eukprot:2813950-Pleurochrysis_carterae.AAC.1